MQTEIEKFLLTKEEIDIIEKRLNKDKHLFRQVYDYKAVFHYIANAVGREQCKKILLLQLTADLKVAYEKNT